MAGLVIMHFSQSIPYKHIILHAYNLLLFRFFFKALPISGSKCQYVINEFIISLKFQVVKGYC